MVTTVFAEQKKMTAEEYLEMERNGIREIDGKFEFFNNQLKPTAGATPNHNSIHKNILYTLEAQIRGKDDYFDLYHSDIRVKSFLTHKDYFYPDVIIVKGKPYFDDENGDNLANPTLIIEVLSKSTEGIDRGDKFKSYRQTPSIKEYLLVSQKEKSIEQFYKDENGRWQIGDIFTEGTFKLQTLPFELSVEDVYRNVDLSKIDPSEMDVEEERKG